MLVAQTIDTASPPPPPPSRSASIRSEPTSVSNPSRPPRFHPGHHEGESNSNSTSEAPAASVAALRAAMFGEKQTGPPALPRKSTMTLPTAPKKSTIKPPMNSEQRPAISATNKDTHKKSSVLKIAAALESSKPEASSSDEGESEPIVNPHSATAGPPTVAKRSRASGQENLHNQAEEGLTPPLGAPYEVPQQGNVRKVQGRAALGHGNNPISSSPQAAVGRGGNGLEDNPPQSEGQSSLASSLQAALANKRAFNKNVARKSESVVEEHKNVSHSNPRVGDEPDTNDLPQQSNLLDRIRQRKAQRPNKDLPSDNSDPAKPTTVSYQDTEEQNRPPLTQVSPKAHSRLRRSSSNVSSIRIRDRKSPPSIPEEGNQKGRKPIQRSPSSVSSRLNNVVVSDTRLNTSQTLHRTPSNASRRSSEECIPQLPPRPSSTSSSGKSSEHRPMHGDMGKPTSDENISQSSTTESMVLADFISRYSSALPMAVSIEDATSVSSKRLIATGQCNSFNVHFLKHSKVVIVHDTSGDEHFSVPLNSCVKFGLVYDQQSNSDYDSYFETAGDVTSLKQLPYVVCATKHFDGGSLEKSVESGEILFVRGIKKTKAIGRGKVLKVNTIDGTEKLLSMKCCGGFTTSPTECRLSLSDMMEHSIPLPQQAVLFGDTQVTSYLPKSMIDQPVILVKIQGESSAIMTPRYDDPALKDQSWMYDVSTDVKVWVKKVQLSKKEQENLNGETNVLHATFDPIYTQHYAEKADDNRIALQHILYVNLLQGKEKEGVHLYLPGATMFQHNFDTNEASDLMNTPRESDQATYALHISEQRKQSKPEPSRLSVSSANTLEIPPNEDSDLDEPEEAYEEVMTALARAKEVTPEPEPPVSDSRVGKFTIAGMFKSMLVKAHKEEVPQPEANLDAAIIEPTSCSEPEDYDKISFGGGGSDEEDCPSQLDLPPPLPDTSHIIGRRPPQIPAPPVPVEQTSTPSIALQRLMAAAKIPSMSSDSTINQGKEQNGYQAESEEDEMLEDEESGYSDVKSLIPSIVAASQASIAATINKRKPPLPRSASPGAVSIKSAGNSSITSASDKVEHSQVEGKRVNSMSGGSGEGDNVQLRGLYLGLQTQMIEMMEEMTQMKARILELSQTVEDLVQGKKLKMEKSRPSKTQTLPRRMKTGKGK